MGDYYRTQYFEAIDLGTAGIKNRFDQPGYTIYSHIEELLVKAANQKDTWSKLLHSTKMILTNYCWKHI